MSFSERMKLVSEKQIQIGDIDFILRHRIINKVSDIFTDNQAKYVLDILGYRTIPKNELFDFSPEHGGKNLDRLVDLLDKLPWNNIYDVIEHGYGYLKLNCNGCDDDCDEIYYEEDEESSVCEYKNKMNRYSVTFNSILEQEKSGYRLIDGLISPIVSDVEMMSIEEASNTKFHPVNIHLQKALQLYSDRENPDYENSIKESISAVEAMCCIITGMTGASATLGVALKKLEDSGVAIHGAMRSAFSQLYGYASDSDGIRHGGIDFKNAPSEDAKYMLVSCSAFINYLIEKYSKIGGEN